MGLKETIRSLISQNGMTAKEFETLMGFGNGYISKLDKSAPSSKNISKIAEYFGVTTDYLLQDGGVLEASSRKNIVPVLGFVAAGVPIEAQENIIDYEEITPEMARRGQFFGLVVKGDSMQPRMFEGDVIICRAQPDAESGDIVVVMVNGDEACVKRLIKYQHGIGLQSLNNVYPLRTYTEDQIENLPVRIIGKVEELRARL